MNDTKELMLTTLKGIVMFFKDIIEKTGGDLTIIAQAENVIRNDSFYDKVYDWLKRTQLTDKKFTLESFIQQIPQLIPYTHLLEQSLIIHESLWDAVFRNLLYIKNMEN